MYLKTIQLINIRGFADLKFDLTRPAGSYANPPKLTLTTYMSRKDEV